MDFELGGDARLLQETVRRLLGRRGPSPGLWKPGGWWDDHIDEVAAELERFGWARLWDSGPELGLVAAGGLELGRCLAPLSLVDIPTLGGPLCLDGFVRYGIHQSVATMPVPGGLALVEVSGAGLPAATLDDVGAVFTAEPRPLEKLEAAEADRRLRAWAVCTVAYLAGLGEEALRMALDYARVRHQFGKPLAAQPVVQQYLADAAVGVEGLTLLAWELTAGGDWSGPMLYAGRVAAAVTDTAQQVLGAYGFVVETGAHRFYRRAKAMAVWNRRLVEVVFGGSAEARP